MMMGWHLLLSTASDRTLSSLQWRKIFCYICRCVSFYHLLDLMLKFSHLPNMWRLLWPLFQIRYILWNNLLFTLQNQGYLFLGFVLIIGKFNSNLLHLVAIILYANRQHFFVDSNHVLTLHFQAIAL